MNYEKKKSKDKYKIFNRINFNMEIILIFEKEIKNTGLNNELKYL